MTFLHDHSGRINLSEALRGETVLVTGLFCRKAQARKHYYDSSYRIAFASLWLESDEIFATAPFLCQPNPRGSLCAWQAQGKIKRIIRRMMNWTVNTLGEKLQTYVRELTKRRIPHELRNALFRPFASNFILKSFRIHTSSPHFITSVRSDLTPHPAANKKTKTLKRILFYQTHLQRINRQCWVNVTQTVTLRSTGKNLHLNWTTSFHVRKGGWAADLCYSGRKSGICMHRTPFPPKPSRQSIIQTFGSRVLQ